MTNPMLRDAMVIAQAHATRRRPGSSLDKLQKRISNRIRNRIEISEGPRRHLIRHAPACRVVSLYRRQTSDGRPCIYLVGRYPFDPGTLRDITFQVVYAYRVYNIHLSIQLSYHPNTHVYRKSGCLSCDLYLLFSCFSFRPTFDVRITLLRDGDPGDW